MNDWIVNGIKRWEFQNVHSDLYIQDYVWKYQYFKWQISQAAMPAGRWGLREILPVLVCHLPAPGKYFFLNFFADSAKCLHEANALCQILY